MVKKGVYNFEKLNKFIYGNFKKSLKYVNELRNYIFFSLFLFLVFAIIGFRFPIFFEQQIIDLVTELVSLTEDLGTFGLISFIVSNNIKSAFFGMILGVLFGVVPFSLLVVNGYVLGFVANKASAVGGSLILWRLLPHGIFEIPAIMIAVGVGLKLGMFLFVSKKRTWGEFRKWILGALGVFLLIVIPLLVIAGIIEGLLIIILG